MRLPGLPALLLPLLLLSCLTAQAQYKWTEGDGTVGYGDQPTAEARNVERIGAIGGALANDPLAGLPFEIRRVARDFPVVLYARQDCRVCDEARAFLRARAIPYQEKTVLSREDIDAFRQLGGGEQLPAASVGRQVLRGFDANAWSEALLGAGYPQGIPLPRGYQWAAATPLATRPPADTPGGTEPAPESAGGSR